LIFTILAIGVLSSLINEFRSSSDGAGDVIHFVCMSVMTITIIIVFKDVLYLVSSTLMILLKQMKIVFPILITLMTSIGSFSTISIYNPLVAVLTTVVSVVFDKLLYPIFIIVFVFAVLGNLTDTVKLDRFQSFMISAFKWIVGIVFTLFTGFLSIQGITAGRYDSVSIKATKFAIKSYIPIIGSYISDGMDFIVLGSVLVKNTIGLVGILVVFLTIVSPVLSVLIIKLGLQLCSAVLEMCGNKKLSDFANSCSKILIMPIVIILGVAFMYFITIALIMCTANIF
jgi:stage III sporulation protein AE